MIDDTPRPDPDELLQRVQREESAAHRGKLKIYFGASAGVGKTYAMLAAAQAAIAKGTELVLGDVVTHGRVDTEAMARDLPRLPMRDISYRDRTLREFDLDGALRYAANRSQPLVLLDELAHSNAPGSRHPKRWQDVEELLAAGVNVWTTINVQHLESLNDIVSGITGIRVTETVPDHVFDQADEVVVVDLPPDELIERLRAGKVYLAGQAERAVANFFRKGNLLALRELALRRTADRVDGEVQAWRRERAVQTVWPNREALLACIGLGDHAEKVIRVCARLAAQLQVSWHAVHVETPRTLRASAAAREQAMRVLDLAGELGAETAVVTGPDATDALVAYAREHNLARLVVGRSASRLPWLKSIADRIGRSSEEFDVLQVALTASARPFHRRSLSADAARPIAARGYLIAAAACVLTAMAATPLLGLLELTNIVMFFLLTVVAVAWTQGRGPAVLAAFLGVGLFDFFFVPPRFSFAVSDVQYIVTFIVMLIVGLAIGQLTAGLRHQVGSARQREHRIAGLYAMSRDLSAALMPEQVAEIGARFLNAEFQAKSTLLVANENDRLQALPGGLAALDAGVADWSFRNGQPAGFGTDTLVASGCLVLPLKAPMRIRGVLAVEFPDRRALSPDQRRALDACASLLATSLERIHYIEVAQSNTVQIESERLRNSLLSAISHDLRTPLAALVGLSETLTMTPPALDSAHVDVAQAIRDSAQRMNAMVCNLLDMARLESGTVRLNRAWQPLDEVLGVALSAVATALRDHEIVVRLDDDLPLLHVDSMLVERAFANILENAAKYTPAGSRIAVSAHRIDGKVRVQFEDSGPGIPAGKEEAIFGKFERGQRESATLGVGLGLAIVRSIVRAHGGDVRAENREQKGAIVGATFSVDFPVGKPPLDDGSGSAVDDIPAERPTSE